MQRVPIRNTVSDKKIKPRLFDLLIDDKSKEVEVEIAVKTGKEVVPLSVLLLQIMSATQVTYPPED